MSQKRFLSWIMVFTLLVGMFSFPAYAEGNNTTTTISGDGTAEKTGTMTVTLVIPKKTPAATDLTYTAPSDLTYSGSDKVATIAAASGVTGLGSITVKYYSDASRTTEAAPKNVGTYYVGATVAEGDQYAASTAVLYGDSWTFTITASTPSAPAAPTKASATKDSITLNAVSGCEYSKDGVNWQSGTEFTGLNPGTEYTFYQRIKATSNTNASAASSAKFSTEADTYAMTITLVIKSEQTITAEDVTATYGDTDKSVSATASGAISYAVKDGSGDYIDVDATTGALTIKKVPSDGKAYVVVTAAETSTYTLATKEVTVIINKAGAVPATVTANTLTYNGQDQALVTVDNSTLVGGTMQYALGTETEATEAYTTSIRAKTDAGTYYVWYKAVADDSGNYADSEATCVAAAISQGAAAPTAPTSDKLTYNGADQALLKAGIVPEGCKMLYALGTDATTAPTDGWQEAVPTGKDAGTYYAWYKIDGGANYNSVAPVCISVEVAKATGTPTDAQKPAAKTGLVANGQAQALLTAPTSLPEGYAKIQYSTDGGKTWSDAIPTGTVAGTYAVSVKYVGDANHNDIDGGSISVTVAEPEPQPEPQPQPEPEPQPAPAPAANPSGIPILTITSAGSDALNFALTNVSGVDGFDLYLTECGNKGAFPLFASVNGTNTTLSGFKVGEAYKGYAQPWVMVNGVKTSVLGATLVSHCFTNNGNNKMTNPGSLTLKKQALTIRLGKTASLKGTVKGVRKCMLINHDAKLRYISSNPAVATVSAKGKVKAVGAGSCDIYVLTLNGIWQRVPVTVDASPSKVKLAKVKKNMAIGETQNLGAKLVLTPTGAVTTFTWTSSNPSVATVDANGVVTALAKGKATITVTTSNGKKTRVNIKVK